jgi:hypothetical protein
VLVHCGPAFLDTLRHSSGDRGDSVPLEVQIHTRKPKEHLVAASFVTLVDISDVTDWFYIVCDCLEIFPVDRVIKKFTELARLVRQLLTLLLVLFGTDLRGNDVVATNNGCLTRRGFQLEESVKEYIREGWEWDSATPTISKQVPPERPSSVGLAMNALGGTRFITQPDGIALTHQHIKSRISCCLIATTSYWLG